MAIVARRSCQPWLKPRCARRRKTLPRNLAFNEGTALAAQAFKAASAEQLAPYHAASEKEKAAYAVVYAAYSAQKAAAEAAARQVGAAGLGLGLLRVGSGPSALRPLCALRPGTQ